MTVNAADRHIELAGPTDLAGFKLAARALLAAGCPPGAVRWQVRGEAAGADALSGDLFAADEHDTGAGAGSANEPPESGRTAVSHTAPPIRVPAWVAELLQMACRHSDPERYALAYRLLWRLQREPGLRHDALDPDRQRLNQMARQVGRDQHKMKAFVRFRPVTAWVDEEARLSRIVHMAWFEPEHHIVEAMAGFFSRRFSNMDWAILTPRCCLHWQDRQLQISPGASKADAPDADAGEALWLAYYRNTFNPARLKLNMMRKEMPRKYWHNLPEASLITELTQTAHERHGQMLQASASNVIEAEPPAASVPRL